ncbi:MAG: triose-phosphate isomerase [Planctomycetes bacterium]|nr:triose-phosphate isomerase [Planctomycetota bacterium]
MRTPLIAGNWKMNTLRAGAVALARAVREGAPADGVEVVLCPPFVHLGAVGEVLRGSRVRLGGQDCHEKPEGAFTGSVSAPMLVDAGATDVIVGHSERRHALGEPDALVGFKTRAALDARLAPIVCVGETIEERKAGSSEAVVLRQLDAALAHVRPAEAPRLSLAYEPVWAIGTGVVATPREIVPMHAALRARLDALWGADRAGAIRILYGGSVNAKNADEILALAGVDGALVGGASLTSEGFLAIVEAARKGGASAASRVSRGEGTR